MSPAMLFDSLNVITVVTISRHPFTLFVDDMER